MKFSKWNYVRPDFSQVKKRINDCKNNMQNAMTYQMFRDAWLDVKKEIEYMVYQEEIIYIRHLCGIDYQYSLEEVEIQNREEPSVYALRDEQQFPSIVMDWNRNLGNRFLCILIRIGRWIIRTV